MSPVQTTQPLSSVEAFALALTEASSRLPPSADASIAVAPPAPPADDLAAAD
ncbi:MAG: hypothetical protein IT293_03245 [Deltaproteobacteria bacterium]|nr:hypothetical protein [Deltaproteobacteria bacterium]